MDKALEGITKPRNVYIFVMD